MPYKFKRCLRCKLKKQWLDQNNLCQKCLATPSLQFGLISLKWHALCITRKEHNPECEEVVERSRAISRAIDVAKKHNATVYVAYTKKEILTVYSTGEISVSLKQS